jgi:hypothetical protein
VAVGGVKSPLLAAPPDLELKPPFEPAVGSKPEVPPDEPETLPPGSICCGEAMKFIPEELPEPPCPLVSELGAIVVEPLSGSVAEPLPA